MELTRAANIYSSGRFPRLRLSPALLQCSFLPAAIGNNSMSKQITISQVNTLCEFLRVSNDLALAKRRPRPRWGGEGEPRWVGGRGYRVYSVVSAPIDIKPRPPQCRYGAAEDSCVTEQKSLYGSPLVPPPPPLLLPWSPLSSTSPPPLPAV